MFCRLAGRYIIPFIRVAVIDLSSEEICDRGLDILGWIRSGGFVLVDLVVRLVTPVNV